MSTTQASSQLIVAQLVPVDRQYEISRANMKVDLDSLPCPAPSKIIGEIPKRHSLKDALTLSASASVIYMQQLWYTLQLTDSKESFNFKLDQQDVEFTIADLHTLLNLPQATDNNQEGFIDQPKLMTIFEFLHIIGHEVKVQALGKFVIKHFHQPWKILCKVLSRCLTTRITELDQASLVQIFYSIINGCHVDYAKLIWDGFMIASGNVEAKGMWIPDELLTEEIRGVRCTSCMMMTLTGKLNETQEVSYDETISAKEAEEKEKLEKVEKAIIVEEVNKMV
ncbi:hypothetical protein Tco_0465569 [Tanacetum coccineum]